MKYYSNFEEIHKLLKEYKCKATYNWEEEYQEGPGIMCTRDGCTDKWFYEPFEFAKTDNVYKTEWEEKVNAVLDVVVKANIQEAECKEIRFDITYSQRVKKYSMYISLPTHGRSVALSKNIYKSQNEVIDEIEKWIVYAKCKKKKCAEVQKNDFEQLSLF